MTTQTLFQGGDADRWDQATYAFLAEKERRSGSIRTVWPPPGCFTASSVDWASPHRCEGLWVVPPITSSLPVTRGS